MSNTDQVADIFSILKSEGINRFQDLKSLELTNGKLLAAQKYPWISELAPILKSMYYSAEEHICNLGGQFFLVDEMKKDYSEELMKYSCLFPERMIVSAGEFHYLDDPNQAFIDIDFFRKLFLGKNLLLNNIVQISPFYLCTDLENDGDFRNAMLEYLTLPDANQKKVAFLDRAGCGNNKLSPFVKSVFVSLPWLKGADIQDYVEIITKNKSEFLHYNQYLSKLSRETIDTQEFVTRYAKDYNEAATNIQISLEKKRAELKRKGIVTAVSICLTIIPLVLPSNIGIDKEVVSSFLGGGTVKSVVDLIPEMLSLKDVEKENPFWVMWKWNNQSK